MNDWGRGLYSTACPFYNPIKRTCVLCVIRISLAVAGAVSDINGALNEDASEEMVCEVLVRHSGVLGIDTNRQSAAEYKETLQGAQERKKSKIANVEASLWRQMCIMRGCGVYAP